MGIYTVSIKFLFNTTCDLVDALSPASPSTKLSFSLALLYYYINQNFQAKNVGCWEWRSIKKGGDFNYYTKEYHLNSQKNPQCAGQTNKRNNWGL
jgi:hypothetical protein